MGNMKFHRALSVVGNPYIERMFQKASLQYLRYLQISRGPKYLESKKKKMYVSVDVSSCINVNGDF